MARLNLSRAQRFWILTAVFLGWMFAGMEMSFMIPATRPAIQAYVYWQNGGEPETPGDLVRMEVLADQWLSRFIAAFLLGAAAGGALFGWLGDRAGRVKAMATSILCYSAITGVGYLANTP